MEKNRKIAMNIQIYGYMHHKGSIPQVTSHWINELITCHNVKFYDYSSIACNDIRYQNILGTHEATVGIYFGSPANMRFSGPLLNGHKIKIGIYVSELELSPMERYYLSHKHDLVVVPSQYVESIFRKHCDHKIMIVHHGIDPVFAHRPEVLKRPNFTFLYVFNNSQTGGSSIRKGFRELVEIFSELTIRYDVRLIVKTDSLLDVDINKIKNCRITIDQRDLSTEELCFLYNSCHAYINPTRAEGFGITPLEAMACGIPVISPIHSGLAEFLDSSNCIIISSNVGKEVYKFGANAGYLWDLTRRDIYDTMEWCYLNRIGLTQRAIEKSESIRSKFSWKNCLQPIMNHLRTT